MARIRINGDIIPNEWKKYYVHLQWEGTCPKDVQDIIDAAAENEPLEVYINSPGGIVTAGQEIYTALRGDSRVSIHVTGQACSAASFIAMAGKSDITPVGLLMVHCASMWAAGNHNEMEKAVQALTETDKAIANAYATKTGMSVDAALELMEKETWLSANRCVELGLIDTITPEAKTGAKAAAAYGGVRLTDEMIAQVEKELEEKETRKEKILSDLDKFGG